jgi:hypothetical protein
MPDKPTTVAQYLAALPADRRQAIEAVRQVFLKNLDKDFEEGIQYGMIGYYVPHRVYPAGYHCDPKQPLPFAGLGSQKNHMAVYLMCVYGSPERTERFRQAWAKAGKKLDMGKACIRFKKLEDLALDVIADEIKGVSAKKYAEYCEAAVQASKKSAPARATARKAGSATKSATPEKGAAASKGARAKPR